MTKILLERACIVTGCWGVVRPQRIARRRHKAEGYVGVDRETFGLYSGLPDIAAPLPLRLKR